MDNPGLTLWLNIAGDTFFMEENRAKKEKANKSQALFMLSLLRVSLQTIIEANGCLACSNHSNIHN